MRLTLRTLLAYLDDTLEAAEIRNIGQKVAENDAAQELIARIKQVTRRRRLTVPPDTGPDQAFDANRVAGYLDSDISNEEVTELEKLCLESDVHLAEAAACHQILTLVMGEPALIPGTARRRMYSLIQGRPAKPSRPPSVTKKPAAEGTTESRSEADPDDSLMALPLFRNLPWLRWALPLGAVVLLLVLGVVLLVPPSSPERVARRTETVPPPEKKETSTSTTEQPKTTQKNEQPPPPPPPPPPPMPVLPPEPAKPLPDRTQVGTVVSPRKHTLVRHHEDKWKRLREREAVHTADQLVSLPGSHSLVRLDRGVDLLLWGNLPETQLEPWVLLESAVTLHHTPAAGPIDVDLTLQRGRVYLTNKKEKGPALIRIRFWREPVAQIWDLTLDEPGTVAGIELISQYPAYLNPLDGDEPQVNVFLYIQNGTAALKVGRRTFADLKGPVGKALVNWDNKGPGLDWPIVVDTKIPGWDIEQPLPRTPPFDRVAPQLIAAVDELGITLDNPTKEVSDALLEFAEDGSKRERRMLGVRSLGAIDAVSRLLDTLDKEDAPERLESRQEALFALKNWLARGKEQGPKLYDAKTGKGWLIDKNNSRTEAEIILGLLYGPTEEQRKQKELYDVLISYLMHRKLMIRELAIWHLLFLTGDQFKIPYNPGAPEGARQEGYRAWKKLLEANRLPPAPPPKPMPDGK